MKLLLLLAGLAALLAGPAARAQQPAAPAPDVLLLTSGQELTGRVLAITPTELTYLASPTPAAPDTLRLPTATVFLVRYANGTRELIGQLTHPAPPDTSPPALRGLDRAQRLALGQHDAQRYYRNSGPSLGAFGATMYLTPLFGLASTSYIASTAASPYTFRAPQPALLADSSYQAGYQQQANLLKRRRAWGGYGVAAALYVLMFASLLAGGH